MIRIIVTAALLAMFASPADARHHQRQSTATYSGQVVSHPSGCPRSAFCGCGASSRVYGHPVRDLYLASNWSRFPSASPAPGMAAWRHGHVFIIEQVLDGNTVLAYDANSGGHQTRIHARSLAGFHVVDPHGTQFASNSHHKSLKRHIQYADASVAIDRFRPQ